MVATDVLSAAEGCRGGSASPPRMGEVARRSSLVDELVRRREQAVVAPPKYVVDDRVLFHENWALAVPAASGCYIISDMRGPLYVGRTGLLRQRFVEHLKRSHNALLRRAVENPWGRIEFSWVLHEHEGLPAAETWLIISLQPICNQTITPVQVDPAAAGRN
jgi:hypothetical protein